MTHEKTTQHACRAQGTGRNELLNTAPPTPKRILIVNADDFGRSERVNRAIETCLREGVVTSTTVMVNMPFAHEAAQLPLDKCSVGLHVTLTEGRPTLPVAQVPSLVGQNGCFYPPKEFVRRILSGRIRQGDVDAEVFNQAGELQKIIGRFSHFDSHQHVHLYPQIVRAILKTGQHFGVKRLRTLKRHFVSGQEDAVSSRAALLGHFIKAPKSVPGIVLKAFQSRLVAHAGFQTPGLLLTATPAIQMRPLVDAINSWSQVFSRLPPGVLETNCHPGYCTGETEVFASSMLRDRIAEAGVDLEGFNCLTSKTRRTVIQH